MSQHSDLEHRLKHAKYKAYQQALRDCGLLKGIGPEAVKALVEAAQVVSDMYSFTEGVAHLSRLEIQAIRTALAPFSRNGHKDGEA